MTKGFGFFFFAKSKKKSILFKFIFINSVMPSYIILKISVTVDQSGLNI